MIGLAAAIVLLAMASVVPGVNVIVLGYLLEVEGRVARGESVRSAFSGLGGAPRVLVATLGALAGLGVLRTLVAVASDARIIDPHAGDAWTTAAWTFAVLLAALYALVVMRYRDQIQAFAEQVGPALGRWIWLGLRGLVVTAGWLLIPAALAIATANSPRGGVFIAFIALVLLAPLLVRLPFLQAHFARFGSLRAGFAWREVGEITRAAPLSCAGALVGSYTLALPLILLAVVNWPRDALWIPSLLFVPLVLAGRLLIGLAYRRASRRADTVGRARFARGLALPVLVCLGIAMALVVFLGPHLSAQGVTLVLFPPGLSVLF